MAQSHSGSTRQSLPGEPLSESADSSRPAWTPSLALLLAAVFSVDALTALVVIAYSNTYLIDVREAPSSYPAYALGIYGLVKLITAPAGGWMLDRLGMRKVVAIVWSVQVAGLICIVGTATARGFLVGVGLLSTGIAISWLLLFHALGDARDPSARGSATAYMGLISVAATAAGVGAAALISETSYWRLAFGLAFVLASGAAILMLWLFGGWQRPLASAVRPEPETAPLSPMTQRTKLVAGAMIFAHFVLVTATLAVFGPFVLRTLDLTLLHAGILLIPAGLAGAGTMVAVGRRSQHGRRLREVALLYGVAAASLLAIAVASNELLFALGAIPFAAALGGAQPLLNASLLDVSHADERGSTGRALGWLFFAEGLGSVAGPLLVGIVIALSGVREGMVAVGLTGSALGVGALLGSKRVRL
ncbi:MAG: MFS transporter [Tepidiformaceae bacterium]